MTSKKGIIKQMWPDFHVTDDDLKQPSMDFLMRLYEKILKELFLLDCTCKSYPLDRVLDPIAVKDGLPKVIFNKFLRNTFQLINGPPFGLEDIIDPEPKRVSKHIDILLNLVCYLDVHCLAVFNQQLADLDEQCLRKDSLIKEIDDCKERLNELAMEKLMCASQKESAEKESDKYLLILDNLNANADQINAERKAYERIYAEETEKRSSLEAAIEKEMQERNLLKASIVPSPESLVHERNILLNQQMELEASYSSLTCVAEERVRIVSELDRLCSMVEPVSKKLKEVGEKQKFSIALEQGLHIDEANSQNAMDRLDLAQRNLQQIEECRAKLWEEVSNFKNESSAMCASLENELEQAKQSKEDAEKEQIKRGAEQVMIAQEIQQWKDEISSLKAEEELFNKAFLEKKNAIDHTVQEFQKRLKDKVELVKAQLEMPCKDNRNV